MNAYLRVTGYYPKADVCFIADSNGRFPDLWEFTSHLTEKGVKIIAVSMDNFNDGDLPRIGEDSEQIILRACGQGTPIRNGRIIEVNGKRYQP